VAGDDDELLVAFRDDLLLVTEATPDGLKALKEILDKPVKAATSPTPALEVQASSAWLLGDEGGRQALRKALPKADLRKLGFRITLAGGKHLLLRLEMNRHVPHALRVWWDRAE
jgi:hypothetical protein